METVTNKINSDLTIKEYTAGIRFGTDALLLSDFVKKGVKGIDLGTGSGVISLLLLKKGKAEYMTGIDIQPEYVTLAAENAENNGLSALFNAVCTDVNDIPSHLKSGEFDFAVSNPPYLKENSGRKNESPMKFTAFHETTADIFGFCKAASFVLKSGGKFYAVYRPEGVSRLICAMENAGIRLKRLRFVHPYFGAKPCLVLAEGRKDGNDGAAIMPPLYITDTEKGAMTPEAEKIYNET